MLLRIKVNPKIVLRKHVTKSQDKKHKTQSERPGILLIFTFYLHFDHESCLVNNKIQQNTNIEWSVIMDSSSKVQTDLRKFESK